MKILKAVFVVILCAMFLFVFGACSADDNSEQPAEDGSAEVIAGTVEEDASGDDVEVVDTVTATAEPADTSADGEGAVITDTMPVTVQYSGVVKEINKEDGQYQYTLSVWDGTTDTDIVAQQGDETLIVDSETGDPVAADAVEKDTAVMAFLSSITTRSIPPIAQAYCLVVNLPAGELGIPTYVEVTQANITDDGDLVVLNQNGDLYVTIPAGVDIGISGEDGEQVPFEQIDAGTKLLCWFDAVMESYPAQAVAYKCVMCV